MKEEKKEDMEWAIEQMKKKISKLEKKLHQLSIGVNTRLTNVEERDIYE